MLTNFSAVKFSSDASVITDFVTDVSDFNQIISDEPYQGGGTLTDAGIRACIELVKDQENPVIVLLTDGTPTRCTPINGGDCPSESNCVCDPLNPTQTAFDFAAKAANEAFDANIRVVPVGITESVSSNPTNVIDLSRCPENPGCEFNLTVEDLAGDVQTVVDEIVDKANDCARD